MSQLAEKTAPAPTRPWRNSKATATRNFVAVFLALSCGALINRMTGLSGFLGFFVGSALLLPVFVAVSNLKRGANVVIDRLASAVIAVAFIAVTIPWLSIFITVFQKGSEAFHSKYLTDDMRITPSGDDLQYGGIAHAIVGTLLMVIVATIISVPFGIIAAIYIVEVKGRFSDMIRLLVQAMSGVPSIVAGLFIFALWMIQLGNSYSAIAGGFALTVLMIPTVARTAEEVLKLIPSDLREAGLALGATQWRTVAMVVIPAARSGLITAVILGIARVVGETAPLLLTIGGADAINLNPTQGNMSAFPYYVWKNLLIGSENAISRAWLGVFVLMIIVLVFFTLARYLGSIRGGKK